jgi:hypothetical protein
MCTACDISEEEETFMHVLMAKLYEQGNVGRSMGKGKAILKSSFRK